MLPDLSKLINTTFFRAHKPPNKPRVLLGIDVRLYYTVVLYKSPFFENQSYVAVSCI